LGVDLGGTSVKLALVDETGRIREFTNVETSRAPAKLAASLREAVSPWLNAGARVLGTGVGVAGDVDPVRGVVRFAPNLRWKNVPLAGHFQKAKFPGPLYFDNDATAAAWGAFHVERQGRSQNLVVLTLGTGVGGGLVFDGRLYRGATGTAGEIGHLTVDPEGAACACGSRGCLEAYLGGAAMLAWANREARRRRTGRHYESPKHLEDEAKAGDALARETWTRAGRALGIGLSSLLNLLNPDTILLTGGVAKASPLLLPAARREMTRRSFATPRRAARIVVSSQNQSLGVVGAALLVP
jgi:glucokinase